MRKEVAKMDDLELEDDGDETGVSDLVAKLLDYEGSEIGRPIVRAIGDFNIKKHPEFEKDAGVVTREDRKKAVYILTKGNLKPIVILNYIEAEDIYYIVDGRNYLEAVRSINSKNASVEVANRKDFLSLEAYIYKNLTVEQMIGLYLNSRLLAPKDCWRSMMLMDSMIRKKIEAEAKKRQGRKASHGRIDRKGKESIAICAKILGIGRESLRKSRTIMDHIIGKVGENRWSKHELVNALAKGETSISKEYNKICDQKAKKSKAGANADNKKEDGDDADGQDQTDKDSSSAEKDSGSDSDANSIDQRLLAVLKGSKSCADGVVLTDRVSMSEEEVYDLLGLLVQLEGVFESR